MIITKEQQEAWVSEYIKQKHTQDECIGFIDGLNKALGFIAMQNPPCKHEYITDANWKSLTCRKCNDRIYPCS